MTLSELKTLFTKELIGTYPNEEVLSFYYLLIEEHLRLTKAMTFLEPNLEISEKVLAWFEKTILSLKQEKPIQYILGKTEFYGLNFKVNKDVLIPRPETEELVAWIILDNKQLNKPLKILDIGTGSGCIAISLAKNLPKSKIQAIDISKRALNIANENANENGTKVDFIEQDILNLSRMSKSSTLYGYDIIVSNPPYVRELEKHDMKNNVLQNEPHLALFVNDKNPLLFYDKIADFAKENLAEKGLIYLEINQYLAAETIQLLEQKEFEIIELREDFFGNKRMLKATR